MLFSLSVKYDKVTVFKKAFKSHPCCAHAHSTFLSLFKHHILLRSAFHRHLWGQSLQHPVILPVVTQQMVSIWSPLTSRFKSLTKTSSSGIAWVLQVKYISMSPIYSQITLKRHIICNFWLLRQQKIIEQDTSEFM